jgi:hypothetical protein
VAPASATARVFSFWECLMKKYTQAFDGFDVHVVVFVEPDPPWVSRVVVRAERVDAGATVPAWSKQITVRKLDSWSAAPPVFAATTVTLHAEASASSGHGEWDDKTVVIRLDDGATLPATN